MTAIELRTKIKKMIKRESEAAGVDFKYVIVIDDNDNWYATAHTTTGSTLNQIQNFVNERADKVTTTITTETKITKIR